jgi:CHAD domain-containing protein
VAQLARLLRRRYALSPSPQSKFTRGLGIFYPHVARTVEPPPVAATDTVAEAARKLLGKYLLRVQQHDPGTRTGEDPESNHAMRVAIRHLRAALRVFKAGVPKPLWRNLKDELDWLGKVLGAARDIDVQLAHLDRQKRARANAALEPLRRHLLAQRRRRQAVLRSALNGPRYAQLIAALDAYALAENDCPKSAAHRGERVLRKEMRRLMTDGRLAMAELTPESLHALRISAKRVRYLVEFFKKLTDQSGKRLTKALVELQDTLGMHHDAAVAIESIRGQLDTLGVSGNRAQAAGLRRFAAAQQRLADRYRRRAQAQWKEFTKARCARDVDRVRRHLTRAADKADG